MSNSKYVWHDAKTERPAASGRVVYARNCDQLTKDTLGIERMIFVGTYSREEDVFYDETGSPVTVDQWAAIPAKPEGGSAELH